MTLPGLFRPSDIETALSLQNHHYLPGMQSTSPSDDEYATRTAYFEDWLKNVGVTVSNKIQLADLRDRSAGRAVLATQDISVDEELFSIPRSTIVTVQTSDLPAAVKEKLDDPWLSLILAMIYEYQRGTESKWKAYFDVLPEEFDTLMYWSEHQLVYLEGSAVVDKIGKKSADTAFTEQIIPVVREYPELVGGADVSDDDILRLCHRMGSIIMAYAFDLERTDSMNEQDGWEEDSDEGGEILPKGMVPLADMLNADADRNNAKLFYEDDKVVMKAIKDVKAGEELFNDYGPLPSADVLRRYGYVTENYARYDVVEISLDIIKTGAEQHLSMDDKVFEARTAYLDEHGILDDGYDISRQSNEDGQFPDELCALLNVLTMPQEDFDKLVKKEKLPKPELSTISTQLLYSVLVPRRSLYPPASQDAETATDGESKRRRAMARQVIEGEKQVLQEAAATLQTSLTDGKKRKADTFEEEAEALRSSSKEAKTA